MEPGLPGRATLAATPGPRPHAIRVTWIVLEVKSEERSVAATFGREYNHYRSTARTLV